jgi:hypothetical protein
VSVTSKIIGLLKSLYGLSPGAGGVLAPSGQVQAAAGTATAPAYAFAGFANYGVFFNSTFGVEVSANGTAQIAVYTGGLLLSSAAGLNWNGNALASAAVDCSLVRVAAGVVGGNTSPATWVQNGQGRARLTANATNATAVMANLADLTVTLKAGRKYTGKLVLFAKNSTAAEGLQIDFNGGTATMTSFEAGFAATPPGAGLALGTLTSTALATALTVTTATTADAVYTVEFTLVCNAAGTLVPRFAEVSHTTGTATAELGSYLFIEDSPN